MYELVLRVFDICRLRKGPEAMPYSLTVLSQCLIAYIALSFAVAYITDGLSSAGLQAGLEILLLAGFTYAVLMLYRKPLRFRQTFSALLGADALVSLAAVPALASLSIGRASLPAFILLLMLTFWHWLITSHIFSRALDESFFFGMGIALLYSLGNYQLLSWLLSELTLV
ncbi:MAG: hypothetical protein RQ715_00870 [Methylococcales bacterium]|nr:hypothetical protein [Methylococcales bacterium]